MVNIPEIKINQPTISLIIGFLALGFSEVYGLKYLFWISLVYTIPLSLVVMGTVIVYLIRYAKKK